MTIDRTSTCRFCTSSVLISSCISLKLWDFCSSSCRMQQGFASDAKISRLFSYPSLQHSPYFFLGVCFLDARLAIRRLELLERWHDIAMRVVSLLASYAFKCYLPKYTSRWRLSVDLRTVTGQSTWNTLSQPFLWARGYHVFTWNQSSETSRFCDAPVLLVTRMLINIPDTPVGPSLWYQLTLVCVWC